MRTVSILAVSCSLLVGALSFSEPLRAAASTETPTESSGRAAHGLAACPDGMWRDDSVCVSYPADDDEGTESKSSRNIHRERNGAWRAYEQIPRRPERPSDYDAYRYPIEPGLSGGHFVISGYDLDLPNESQRRGPRLRATGHGAVDLPQQKGAPVHLVPLEYQQGPAEVLYAGPLFGTTVITRHTVRESGALREYVLLFGHLDSIAPGLLRGTLLRENDRIGSVGDTGSPELVHLHLEARRVRDGYDIRKAIAEGGGGAVLLDQATVVVDPRNVLPLAR